jgi:hypothetical protein
MSSDLRGASRLIVDAVLGVTGVVESMHRNISGLAPVVGASLDGGTRGITGLVYRSVRGVTRVVGLGLDVALVPLAPLFATPGSSPRREAVLAALNGVFGDALVAADNPLAIPMRLRRDGRALTLDRQALAEQIPRPGARLVVLVHGLCMNDLQWHRDGHDHGGALARDLGFTALYVHYNSGRAISANGRELAALLEQLVAQWPVPIAELAIVGHSMGGLVARSACRVAELAGHSWLEQLQKLVFLGTPHHGAPLERAGHWVDQLLEISPYSAPLARLGKIRSAGVKDLRHGSIVAAEGRPGDGRRGRARRPPVPLPRGVRCFALAATRQAPADPPPVRLRGDGLVPVGSALGEHEDAALSLRIPRSRQRVVHRLGHLDLLGSHEVYDQLRRWLR